MSVSIKSSLVLNGGRIRLMEAHDYISNRIVRSATSSDGRYFHGVWVSGLTQTTYLGVPDTELVTPLQRALAIDQGISKSDADTRHLCAAFDADSGGPLSEIQVLSETLVGAGIGMVIIEDKEMTEPGQKVNSLASASASQGQADMHEFAKTLSAFKAAKVEGELLVTARIESFTTRVVQNDDIAEKASVQVALEDALERAVVYRAAGADSIMIHSKSKKGDEVIAFLKKFRAKDPHTTLVVVPTTYSNTSENVLYEAGANVIIYTNHLMRAKLTAAQRASEDFLRTHPDLFQRGSELDACVSAGNFGCLLPKMTAEGCSGQLFNQYRTAIEQPAIESMEITARNILEAEMASGADEHIISAKQLLHINSHQVSSMVGSFQVPRPTLDESTSSSEEEVVVKTESEIDHSNRIGCTDVIVRWTRSWLARANSIIGGKKKTNEQVA